VVPEGGGVPADSDDDYDDPLMVTPLPAVAANVTVAAAASSLIPPVLGVGRRMGVDADGAPILSQLAMLPIVSPRTILNGSATVSTLPVVDLSSGGGAKAPGGDPRGIDIDDDDVLVNRHYAPEDDFVDWNFSVKFFRFIRSAPSRPETPTPPTVNGSAAAVQQARPPAMESGEESNSNHSSMLSGISAGAGRGSRGGGAAPRGRQPRGDAGGGGRKRRVAGFTSEESDEDSPVERRSKAKGQRPSTTIPYVLIPFSPSPSLDQIGVRISRDDKNAVPLSSVLLEQKWNSNFLPIRIRIRNDLSSRIRISNYFYRSDL